VRDYPHNDGKVVRVTVSYTKGGLNMFTYKEDKRGYWMHIQPMRIETSSNGFTVSHYMPMSGRRMLVLEAARFSASGLAKARGMAADVLDNDDTVAAFVVDGCRRALEEV
jgi:hypothetical protein